jgi:hydroxyisourate hydrolase
MSSKFLFLLGAAAAGAAAQIYVSPSGNDAAPGTQASPVRSLERARDLARASQSNKTVNLAPGAYRLIFDTATYFKSCNALGFYPQVSVEFEVRDPESHYHVPLLLSPYGYSTYRGS